MVVKASEEEDMEKPVLSIIVPVYKVELYLHQCIDSILAQTFKNFELILIDDGSPDGCPQICDAYVKQDARVQVLHKPNEGLQSAWISGLNISNGKYIGFVDSDDWIEQEMLVSMLAAMDEYHADIVQCGYRRMIDNHCVKELAKLPAVEVFENQAIYLNLVPQILNFWAYANPIIVPARWNKIFRREMLINNLRYCDTRINLGEDLNITLPVLLDARKVVCLNKCYYNYRLNNNSITKGYKQDFWQKNLLLFTAISNIAQSKQVDISRYAEGYFNYLTIATIFNASLTNQSYKDELIEIKQIYQENPGKDYLNTFKAANLSLTGKLIYQLLKYKLFFLIPGLLRLRNLLK